MSEHHLITAFIDKRTALFMQYKYGIAPGKASTCCPDLSHAQYQRLLWELSAVNEDNSQPMNLIQWSFFAVEPVLAGITLELSKTQSPGAAPISLDFTPAASGKFLVFSENASQPERSQWNNTLNGMDNPFNYGSFPDQIFRQGEVIGDRRYYVSRTPVYLDSRSSVITFK